MLSGHICGGPEQKVFAANNVCVNVAMYQIYINIRSRSAYIAAAERIEPVSPLCT
jgi:hypothetical protein